MRFALEQIRMRKWILIIVLTFCLLAAALEIGMRVVVHMGFYQRARWKAWQQNIADYQVPAPTEAMHWTLRPNLRMTLEEVLRMKEQQERTIGLSYIRADASTHQIGMNEVVFETDKDGYKGPNRQRERERERESNFNYR